MNIKKELEPNCEKICNAAKVNIPMNIGTGLQEELHLRIRPLLPNGIGYQFMFNMSGMTEHIFYEIANTENRLVF